MAKNISASLRSKSVYVLAISGPMVEAPYLFCCGVLSSPSATDKTSSWLPNSSQILAQGPESKRPIYVTSVPRFIDALLDQQRYRQAHVRTYSYVLMLAMLPSYHLTNLVRYLHLEKPYQREKFIPELAERNRADMETPLKKYKRKPLLMSKDFVPSALSQWLFAPWKITP